MKRFVRTLIGFAAAVLGLAWSPAWAAEPAGGALGADLAGETCRASTVAAALQPFDILCGTVVVPVSRVRIATPGRALPQDAAARHTTILANATTLAGSLAVNEQMTCAAGLDLPGANGADNLLFLCTLQNNGWPRIILVSAQGTSFAYAEGLPAMLPVLQTAIARASGHAVVQSDAAAALRLIQMRLAPKLVKLSNADYASYELFAERGRLYSAGDNFGGAETAFRGALEIEIRIFDQDAPAIGLTLVELALQVSNQGRFEEAAGLFARASPIVDASASANVRARFSSYLALDAANQRHFVEALTFARDATAARRAEVEAATMGSNGGPAGPAVSSGELAHSLRIEAQMAMRLDDLANAQAAAGEALWIISQEKGLPLRWRPDVLSLLAEINERQGRVVPAERNFRDALALQQKLFGDSAPTVRTQLRMGQFYADQQLYPAALSSFRAALATLAKDAVARAQIVPDQIVPFVAAAEAAGRDPQLRPALDADVFRASQFVNSDVTDQTIARMAVRVAAGNPQLADLVREAQEAQRQRDNARIGLAAEYAKRDDERSSEREAALGDLLKTASARAGDLLNKVQQSFPDYAKLADPAPAELTELSARLRPGEAFLSFVIGVNRSYALLVTPRGLTTTRLEVTADSLAADIAEIRRAFVPQFGALPPFSLKNAFALYSGLLAPLERDLRGVDHLIVAPTGPLASLPFSVLITANPGESQSYTDARWLIRRMALSQVPSPRAFLALRAAQQNRVAAPRPFLGIGDPLFAGSNNPLAGRALDTLAQACREGGPMPPELLRALPPLPETAEEVNAVARALGSGEDSVLLKDGASETNLRAHMLDQYGVLYFASHGLLPGELHCQTEPGLVLSPPATPASSTDADGLLDASEIATLKLNADLVVLSACNTAAPGGRFGGRALEGLADAFFNAGARSVLASQWDVPSAATTRLMIGVFQRLRQTRTSGLAEALRQMQLSLTADRTTAHPFNWAAFILIGDSATLTSVTEDLRPEGQAFLKGEKP